jgi:hypothetical protein
MDNYRTSDIYFAAFLKAADVAFLGTEQDEHDNRRTVFLFENSDTMRDLRNKYFNRTAKVPALTYADEIKALKSMTFGR